MKQKVKAPSMYFTVEVKESLSSQQNAICLIFLSAKNAANGLVTQIILWKIKKISNLLVATIIAVFFTFPTYSQDTEFYVFLYFPRESSRAGRAGAGLVFENFVAIFVKT